MSRELTSKERLFALEYLADEKLNPERAALRAGYSASVARTKAYVWVSRSSQNPKAHIADFISRTVELRESNLQKKIKRLEEEITRICYSDIGLIIIQMGGSIGFDKLKDVDPDLRAAISGITVTDKGARLTLHNKNKAIELKGKIYGIWNSRDEDFAYKPKVVRGNESGRT